MLTKIENIHNFKRVSSLSNIPRPSSSNKFFKESQNALQVDQSPSQKLFNQSQQNINGANTKNLKKQQAVVSSVPVDQYQNIKKSTDFLLTYKGKQTILEQTNVGAIPTNVIQNNFISSQQQQCVNTIASTQNSCQNTSRNLSQNCVSSSTIKSNIIGNKPYVQMQKCQSQVFIKDLSNAKLQTSKQLTVQIKNSQQNLLYQKSVEKSDSNNLIITNQTVINNSNKNILDNYINKQNEIKIQKDIILNATTKQICHKHNENNHDISKQIQKNDFNNSINIQNESQRRVLTTPNTLQGLDNKCGNENINIQKKQAKKIPLKKQQTLQYSQQSTKVNSSSNKENCNDLIHKLNRVNKKCNTDKLDCFNFIKQSQSSSTSVLNNTKEKCNTEVKKKENFNQKDINYFRQKEMESIGSKQIEYYKQKEIEYQQQIQKLEKENKIVSCIVSKSNQETQLLRSEINNFRRKYNQQASVELFQEGSILDNFFQYRDEGQSQIINFYSDQTIQNSNSMHISELQSDYESIQLISQAENQEKINLLKQYSFNLENKLKQLEKEVQFSSSSSGKSEQQREVMNNCYKLIEQKYLSLYQKTAQQQNESNEIQSQIQFYSERLSNQSDLQNMPQINNNVIISTNDNYQKSYIKALNIGKQISQNSY